MKYNFDQTWEDFSGKIRTFISRRVSNPSYIDDILQEVFLKIHLHLDGLEGDSKISSWIFKIAHNTVIDFYRKQKAILLPLDEEYSAKNESRNSAAYEIASGLEEMVNTLPEKYAKTLILVEFSGLSNKEASQKLGISVSGVKSRVQRARKMIKDSLMRCCHFVFDRFGTILDYHPITCCCCREDSKE
jgi:RNA polymerase sigma-70 factor (ECF subfamily)